MCTFAPETDGAFTTQDGGCVAHVAKVRASAAAAAVLPASAAVIPSPQSFFIAKHSVPKNLDGPRLNHSSFFPAIQIH